MNKPIAVRIFLLVVSVLISVTSCKKEEKDDTNPIVPTPTTVTDADGNVYHTVKIGSQTWMVENLRTTHYKDGTPVPRYDAASVWTNLSTPGFCWFDNDSVANASVYGALYNWYAVNTGNLAPAGWHVATESDWAALSTQLGGDGVSGGKLKEAGTVHWMSPNVGATNESGFIALPGGNRSNTGLFGNMGYYGYWWTSTSFTSTQAASYFMNYSNAGLGLNYDTKRNGFSVRCVKD